MAEEKQKKRGRKAFIYWFIFILILAISVGVEFLIPEKKSVYGIDGERFFFAGYGFLSCAAIIIFSKIIGVFLKRKENYYKEIRHDE